MKIKILVVDDDLDLAKEVSRFLKENNYDVKSVGTLEMARKSLAEFQPDVILLDLKLPDGSGIDFLPDVKDRAPETIVVMLSGYGNIPIAVDAIKQGANDFLTKPVEPDYLLFSLERLVEQKHLRNRLIIQDLEIADRRKMILGTSKLMQDVLENCQIAAQRDSTILLTGETGTGKQLLAHFIHQNSPRKDFSFVYINCATLSETLLESDLFGHEKGSFTGAMKQKRGRVELANNGTLFLDEIGELPLNLQSKLLHFIEYGEFQRVGGLETLRSSVRTICATNRNLEMQLKEGKFREDLFYRINIIQITIPPLRDRKEDIPVLISYFMEKYSRELGKPNCRIPQTLIDKLVNYGWPGNIRELQNALERATVFCKSNQLTPKDFPLFQINTGKETNKLFQAQPLQEALNAFKKQYISKLLKTAGNNQTQVAKILKIQRTYLNRLIRELEIQ